MRAAAFVAAAGCIALVLAQDFAPAWAGFHSWQYAAALTIGAFALGSYALGARKGEDGEVGVRLVVAAVGVLVITVAGLASGLLGPDTQTVTRPPGTVTPLPDVGAAAFFPNADAAAIARGDARVVVRRRGAAPFDLGPGQRRYVGATALSLASQSAAYVDARDAGGGHLTITQPTSAAFLSPVLLFPQSVPVAGRTLPADAFATPALHRQIKAFYFSKAASSAAAEHGLGNRETILFAVDDDAGRLLPGAIGFARSDEQVVLGGVRLRATLGRYPALVVSAIPYPPALWLGGVLLCAGLAYAYAGRGRSVVPTDSSPRLA